MIMTAVAKIADHSSFALTRESGDSLFELISEFLNNHSDIERVIIDFEDISDVSVSFIQATVLKLIDLDYQVELVNLNDSIRFKIATLVKVSRIDPALFKTAKSYPLSPVFV